MAKLIPQAHGGAINRFEKGESGNPNGQPKKSFRLINKQLKKEGYEELKKIELLEAYGLIFNTNEDRLQELAKDKSTPYALRIIILEMNNKQLRARALADYRDYMFGKAIQTTKGEIEVKATTLSKEEQEIIDNALKENGVK